MLELTTICSFALILLICIVMNYSVIYALLIGYFIFCAYGLIKKFTLTHLLKLSWKGIKTVRNILYTFLMIGMITAIWRACGTVPFVIYYAFGIIVPSMFVLAVFLLCCLISTLTGTSLGTAATVGVICMTLSNAMNFNKSVIGGAILAGVFFGDRCSPMSTSALLVGELTETDIYINIKNMVRTSVVPFIISCLIYLLLGLNQREAELSIGIRELFINNFNLHWVVVLPAVFITVLCIFRVNVKIAMTISIITGSIICFYVQGIDVMGILKLSLFGFRSSDAQLAAMMNGGGIVSMAKVTVIVFFSSSYSGIFDETGLLDEIKVFIIRLSEKITSFGSTLIISIFANLLACSQSLGIILTYHLCKASVPDKEQLAIYLENTTVVIAALIPWSIACAVPLTTIAAPNGSILAAFYLYLLPLWNLIYELRKRNKSFCAYGQ